MPTTLLEKKPERKVAGPGRLDFLLGALERDRRPEGDKARFNLVKWRPAISGLTFPAGVILYALGHLSGEQASALVLSGWAVAGRLDSCWPVALWPLLRRLAPLAVRALDSLLLLGVGLFLCLRQGWPEVNMLWTVACSLTIYLCYYSQVAILKAVPAGLRTSKPETMVAADHMFISGSWMWGADRLLVLGLAAAGLLAGVGPWGMAVATIAGNLYWILKVNKFWQEEKNKNAHS
ncbi:MAG: hypothetical protein U9P14_01290 [Gemmatimonadota bacterium]|nr:hypothetical protein [Gemmatimonadota bacterium]